jgi:hypothetical protein
MGVQLPSRHHPKFCIFNNFTATYGRLWRPIARRPGTNMSTVPISLILNELLQPSCFCQAARLSLINLIYA